MKIYANSNSDNLDQFIGKDLWVKIKIIDPYLRNTERYIRILSKGDFKYSCYGVMAYLIDDADAIYDITFDMGHIKSNLFTRCTYYCEDLKLYTPISMYTTEEIIEILGLAPNEVHI